MNKLLMRLLLGKAALTSDWSPIGASLNFREDFFILTFEYNPCVWVSGEHHGDVAITFYYSVFSCFMIIKAYKISMDFLNNPDLFNESSVYDARYYVDL